MSFEEIAALTCRGFSQKNSSYIQQVRERKEPQHVEDFLENCSLILKRSNYETDTSGVFTHTLMIDRWFGGLQPLIGRFHLSIDPPTYLNALSMHQFVSAYYIMIVIHYIYIGFFWVLKSEGGRGVLLIHHQCFAAHETFLIIINIVLPNIFVEN